MARHMVVSAMPCARTTSRRNASILSGILLGRWRHPNPRRGPGVTTKDDEAVRLNGQTSETVEAISIWLEAITTSNKKLRVDLVARMSIYISYA